MAKVVKVKGAWLPPMWRIPFVLVQYRSGKKSRFFDPDSTTWLDMAVASGLVQMVDHKLGEKPTCYYLEPIDKDMVLPFVSDAEIDAKIQAGIQSTMERLREPPKPPKPPKQG